MEYLRIFGGEWLNFLFVFVLFKFLCEVRIIQKAKKAIGWRMLLSEELSLAVIHLLHRIHQLA